MREAKAIAHALGIEQFEMSFEKEKKNTSVPTIRCGTGQPRKTTAVDDKYLKKNSRSNINNLHRARVKVSQSIIQGSKNLKAILQDANPLISRKNQKARLEITKNYRDET